MYKAKRVLLETEETDKHQPIAMADGEFMGEFPLLIENHGKIIPIILHPRAYEKLVK
jgi:hypothetical protein